jgi:hypothetical protein
MKKLIVTLFVTMLAGSGLVVATGGTAFADCTPSQYSGCVATKTKALAPDVVSKGSKATVCAKVKAIGSDATPVGEVVIKVDKNSGGQVSKATFDYSGGQVCAKTGKLTKKGGYTVTAKFKSPSGSIFINSTDGAGFDVVR